MKVKFGVYLGIPGFVIAAWFALTISKFVDPLLLPAPRDVAFALGDTLVQSNTYDELGRTVVEILLAFAIAAILGVGIGLPIGWYRTMERAYTSVLGNIYSIPLIVLYPVIALVFGIGSPSKIVFGGLYAFFPIILAVIAGVAGVDQTLISAGRSMGAGGRSLLRTIVIPAAMPRIMVGLRLGLVLATIAVVGGQFIAGSSGLGYLLATTGQTFQTVQMFAYIILTLGLAAVLNGFLALLDRLTIRSFS